MLAIFKGLPLAQKIGVGLLAVVLIVTGIAIVNNFVNRSFDSAESAGAAKSAAKAAEEGLSHVEAANAAAQRVARDPDYRDAECLLNSRTPENC